MADLDGLDPLLKILKLFKYATSAERLLTERPLEVGLIIALVFGLHQALRVYDRYLQRQQEFAYRLRVLRLQQGADEQLRREAEIAVRAD